MATTNRTGLEPANQYKPAQQISFGNIVGLVGRVLQSDVFRTAVRVQQNTPSSAVDVVGIFDGNFNQLFTGARAVAASVFETSKIFEHPLENGSAVSDHRILNPIEIDLQLLIPGEDYRDTYRAIKRQFIAGESVTIRTRTDDYPMMMIVAMPHEEEPALWETVRIVLNLKEMIMVQSQFQPMPARSVKRGSDQSTIKRGDQQESTAHKIFFPSKAP